MKQANEDEPLTMAVHAMPHPEDMGHLQPRVTGRWQLLVIVLLCSLPIIGAYYVYFQVRPQGQASFGALITPVRPAGALAGQTLDGRTVALDSFKGKWLLAYVSDGNCDARCRKQLYMLRQMRESLGHDKGRVEWAWLIRDQSAVADDLRKATAEAVVLRLPPEALAGWLDQDAASLSEHLFLIDPLGNAMMQFPATLDVQQAYKALRDIDRLLHATALWNG